MKATIKEVIRNFQNKKIASIISRKINVPLNSGKVVSLIGTRRAGKTYLLYQKISELRSAGLDSSKIIFINFEDERLTFTAKELDLILQSFRELYPEIPLEECYFFFDEIQNVEGWEKFVRRVYDQESKHIFITGSNAKLLSTEIATALRGRTLSYEVYPLSFSEYLEFKGINQDIYVSANKAKIVSGFHQFMLTGGFPELVGEKDTSTRNKILQEYFNVMIFRDLVERFNVANVQVLKYFIKKILTSVTSPISVNRIYNDLKSSGYSTSKNSLYTFFDQVNDIFLLRMIDKFDYSSLKRAKSDKKAYAIDHGFLAALNYQFSEDKGKVLENLVALEFFKRQLDITYFKQTKECDFVVVDREKTTPFQVAYTIENSGTRKRELDGLIAACNFLDCTKGYILTMEEEETISHKGFEIEVVPAWKYFL